MTTILNLVFQLLAILAVYCIAKFFIRLYQVRMKVRAVSKNHEIEILPHSFIFGHLLIVANLMGKQPPNLSGQILPLLLLQKYPKLCAKGAVYVDTWPIGPPMLAVFHPQMADQFTQKVSLSKHLMMKEEMEPLTGSNDLVSMEGQTWKKWRSVFNPGFSARNVLSLVPSMVEEALVMKATLEKLAESEATVPLEDMMMKATVDVIGRVVLDTRLHAQTATSPLFDALQKQIGLLLTDNGPPNIVKALNPTRPLLIRYYNHIMKSQILPHIERQMSENTSELETGPKTVNSLAIKSYIKEISNGSSDTKSRLDSQFIEMAISQMKIFLLAGHDTTSSTLCFSYYLLNRYPNVLEKVLNEHDEVLGTDASLAASRIVDNPALLNQLTYTNAVLKETLRLYPPVGTVRQGAPDVVLTQPETGERFPTDGCMLFVVSQAMHRWDALWPRADEMIPERWLVKERDPLYPRKGAFRPFELGPRNCIGQELAMVEMRLILALTLRELRIVPQFAISDPKMFGEQGFQCMTGSQITAHPVKGMPVKILRR